MKQLSKYLLIIIMFGVFANNVSAASYNTPVKSDMSYDECINFQDDVLSTNTNGYFGHCIKATCYSGVWQTQYYISDNMVKCNNGNQAKYNQVINNGCTPYVGSCNPSTKVKYCSLVSYFDCNKTSTGGIYTPPTLAPPTSTTTTKPNTTKPNTTKPNTTKPNTTTKPITTTPVVKSNNNYLSGLEVTPGNLEFSKLTETYHLEIEEGITSVVVVPTLEDSKAKYDVKNNVNINVDIPIIITVTAEDETIRVYTINLSYAENGPTLNSNSKIKDIKIKNHSIKFNKDVLSYTVKIDKEEKLDIEVILDSETSKYNIIGNKDLKNRSKIKILVTAEDASETTYLINIKQSSNLGGAFIVILVVGIAGFVGFKLIRKITSKEEESRYEYE